MLLSAHRNIVLRDHFIDQFLGPLLKRVLLDLRKHSHIGRHHFFLEIFALSDRGVMLVAENEHSRHSSASQVDQKARSLHDLSIDHEQVGENWLDELRMRLDQLVQTLEGGHAGFLVELDQLDSLRDENIEHFRKFFNRLLVRDRSQENSKSLESCHLDLIIGIIKASLENGCQVIRILE